MDIGIPVNDGIAGCKRGIVEIRSCLPHFAVVNDRFYGELLAKADLPQGFVYDRGLWPDDQLSQAKSSAIQDGLQSAPVFSGHTAGSRNKIIKILFGSEEGQLLAGLQASISGRGYSHLSILPDGKQIEVIFDLE